MSSFKYTKHDSGAEQFGGPLRRESAVLSSGVIDSPAPAALGGELNFSVRYALPEYVSFMWQHAGYLIRRRRHPRA